MSTAYRPEVTEQIEREKLSVTVRNIDVVLTKINIQPGDVLLMSAPPGCITTAQDAECIRDAFREGIGVPVVLLRNGLKVDAVLSVAPECLELVAAERDKRATELAENIRKVMVGKK
jgi:hypothetical protein